MTLLSAGEDLEYRTLAEFESALEKLAYLARLRDEDGHYHHWGMSRTYGEQASNQAMSELHTRLWLEVLRTPIPQLSRQLGKMEISSRTSVMRELKKYRALSHPANLSGGGVRHFNSVLLALENLSHSLGATHQAA